MVLGKLKYIIKPRNYNIKKKSAYILYKEQFKTHTHTKKKIRIVY